MEGDCFARVGVSGEMSRVEWVMHHGGCHCGAVRFQVLAPPVIEVTECNCSMCSMFGFLHLIVPADRFTLLQGENHISTYTFNTATAKHHFCNVCGVKSFYVPRSHPDGFSVNARCLDEGTVEGMTMTMTNGKEWEKAYPQGRGSYS